MADARRRDAWSRQSEMMALLANINRDPKRRPRPFTADDFTPFPAKRMQRTGGPRIQAPITVLRDLFVGRGAR